MTACSNGLKQNRADLRRLFVQKNQMEKETRCVARKVHASECKVVDLRRKALSADEAEQSAVRRQTQNQRLLVDVREARRRLLEAEQQYEPMKQELQAKARLACRARIQVCKGAKSRRQVSGLYASVLASLKLSLPGAKRWCWRVMKSCRAPCVKNP